MLDKWPYFESSLLQTVYIRILVVKGFIFVNNKAFTKQMTFQVKDILRAGSPVITDF